MKGFILIISLITLLPISLLGNEILIKTNPRTYQINVKTMVKHSGSGISRTNLFLAYMASNEY